MKANDVRRWKDRRRKPFHHRGTENTEKDGGKKKIDSKHRGQDKKQRTRNQEQILNHGDHGEARGETEEKL